ALAPVLDERDVRARARGDRRTDRHRDPIVATKPFTLALFHAARISASLSFGAIAITEPPPPAPVSLAPYAPSLRATSHSASSNGVDTPSPPSSSCARFMSRPSASRLPSSRDAVPVSHRLPSSRSRVSSTLPLVACATRSTIAAVDRGAPLGPTSTRSGGIW